MASRVCAEPGCPWFAEVRGRCADHARAKDKARGSRQQRGYDADYEAQLQTPEYLAATHCANCGSPFAEDNPKTGGHSVALRKGGRGSKILPHCRRCNYGWQASGL